MSVWEIGLALYILTAIVAVTLTHREQRRRDHRTAVHILIGYTLCMIWPFAVAVMVLCHRTAMALDRME